MKFKDAEAQAGWDKTVEVNQDPYGKAGVDFALRWANMMEARIPAEKLEDIADATSHDADTEGITGFMYGMAVSILSQVWIHGDALRVWHNSKYGVSADEPGTVNPAIINIG